MISCTVIFLLGLRVVVFRWWFVVVVFRWWFVVVVVFLFLNSFRAGEGITFICQHCHSFFFVLFVSFVVVPLACFSVVFPLLFSCCFLPDFFRTS